MQRALMGRVLEILLEVENLTSTERTHVKEGLAFIQSGVTETSTRLTRTTPSPNLEALSDLPSLISIRYAHQSEEEANSVRTARTRVGVSVHQGNEGDPETEENLTHPHRPPADVTQDSERRHIAKEINEIIKASTVVFTGESTGMSRRARWGMEKPAAGSAVPVDSVVTATGNSANARLAARQSARGVGASLLWPRLQLTLGSLFSDRNQTGR